MSGGRTLAPGVLPPCNRHGGALPLPSTDPSSLSGPGEAGGAAGSRRLSALAGRPDGPASACAAGARGVSLCPWRLWAPARVSELTLLPRRFSGDMSHSPLVRPEGSRRSARVGGDPRPDAPYLVEDYSSHRAGDEPSRRSNQKRCAFEEAVVSAREKKDDPQMSRCFQSQPSLDLRRWLRKVTADAPNFHPHFSDSLKTSETLVVTTSRLQRRVVTAASEATWGRKP